MADDGSKWQLVLPDGRIVIANEDSIVSEEAKLEPVIQLRGILKALRIILDVPQGESILTQAYHLMRQKKLLRSDEVSGFLAQHKLSVLWHPITNECVIYDTAVIDKNRRWSTVQNPPYTSLQILMQTIDKAKAALG